MEYIYGQGGKVIGYLHKSGATINGEHIDVYDGNNRYVGHVDDSGTYDETGAQISNSRMPGLLLKYKDDNDL
jgi:hypothetical protein